MKRLYNAGDIHQELPEELKLGKVHVLEDGHGYEFEMFDSGVKTAIYFAKGGRNQEDRTAGLSHDLIILMVLNRLKYFKEQFPNSDENDRAIELATELLKEIDGRTIKRAAAGVLGNNGEDLK